MSVNYEGKEHLDMPALTIIAFLDEDSGAIADNYLFWFVKLILFRNSHTDLTVEEIRKEIEDSYLLTYTDEEIIDAIESCGEKTAIEKSKDASGETKYSLSSLAMKEIARLNKASAIRKYVDDYCDKFGIDWWNDEVDFSANDRKVDSLHDEFRENEQQKHELPTREDLVNLLSKFIYRKFRESLNQLDGLLSITGHFTLKQEDENTYTSSERRFINKFLSWDNEGKNQMIYNLIDRSFDFYSIQCHEDIRFDFNDYIFILDANILMRLMKINNEYRYESVSQFIKKARDIGVKLVVSAFTKEEVRISVEHQIDAIKDCINRAGRIFSPQAGLLEASSEYNPDLYRLFYDWCKDKKDERYNSNALEKFKTNLYRELDKIISEVTFDEHPSFSINKDVGYEGVVQSLKEIRKNDWQAKTDANNVLLTLEYKETKSNTYMVSSDQALIHWSKDTYQAQRSLIEVPSVWLSVMIRYSGRAIGEDDYKAFCQFIRLPIDNPLGGNVEARIRISDAVNKSDYSDFVKDRILEEIGSKGKMYLSLEKNAAIKLAHDEVLKAEREAGFAEAEELYANRYEQLKKSKDEEISELKEALDTEKRDRELGEIIANKMSLNHHVRDWVEGNVAKYEKIGAFVDRNKNTIKLLIWIAVAACVVVFVVNACRHGWQFFGLADWIALIFAILFGLCELVVDVIQERYSRKNLTLKFQKKAIKKFILNDDFFDNNLYADGR